MTWVSPSPSTQGFPWMPRCACCPQQPRCPWGPQCPKSPWLCAPTATHEVLDLPEKVINQPLNQGLAQGPHDGEMWAENVHHLI